MRTVKRFMAAVLAACLLTPAAAFAQETAADASVKYFTIDQAIEYAKENNLDLIAKRESEEYERLNNEAVRVATKNAHKSDYGVSSISGYLLSGGYNYEATQTSYRVARRNTIKAQASLESTVKQAFYKCVNQKKKIALAQDSLTGANDRLSYANVKFNSGMISQLDVQNFELASSKAQNELNTQQRTLDEYILSLKTVMNYPLDKNIDVTGSFERVPMDTTSLEDARIKMESSIDRANIDDNYKLSETKFKYYSAYYTSNLYEYQAAKYELSAAKANYQNNLNSLETGLTSAYNQLQSIYESLDYLDASLRYSEATAQAAKLRYEMGMMTADDYNTAVQQLDSVKNTIADTELNAYAVNEAYRQLFANTNTVTK